MNPDDGTIQIRSYRVCFKLDRRLHKIDRWRIPVPHGIPLRGLGYALVVLATVFMLGRLPVIGDALGLISPWVRYLGLPAVSAYLLTELKVDGRSPHAAGVAWLRMRLRPARLSAFRRAAALGSVRLGEATVVSDERTARYRPGVVEGPARVVLRYPAQLRQRGRTLLVSQESDKPLWRGKQVDLRMGQRVVLK
jgi:hypothetical protein